MPNKITFKTDNDDNVFKKGDIIQVVKIEDTEDTDILGVTAIVIELLNPHRLQVVDLSNGGILFLNLSQVIKIKHSVIIN